MHHDRLCNRDSFSEAPASPLDDAPKYALAIGAVLVLLLPEARGFSGALGWLPLWLLGMPASALWALRGCPMPRLATRRSAAAAVREHRRRRAPQARRRGRALPCRAASRAA